ncbi:hypothetical protein PAHAL_5G101300 [Panicum hallii]|uniref:Uncharacterized protein n=1 Tax=Panicum hallii TaxID=206008 RepID=A0A2T8IJM9_9POAL|nr:hypothetical protein PAHAL_5G101300 [Panicum hallii]
MVATLHTPSQASQPALAFSTSSAAQATGSYQKLTHRASGQRERKEAEESSNGVRVPLQRLRRQQGEEAAAQAGAAQAADRQDPAGQPGAGRRRRRQQGAQLREMSKLLLADRYFSCMVCCA